MGIVQDINLSDQSKNLKLLSNLPGNNELMSTKFDLCFTCTLAVIYVISCDIGLDYNDICQIYLFSYSDLVRYLQN